MCNIKGMDWTGCPGKRGHGASFGKCVFKRCTVHKLVKDAT